MRIQSTGCDSLKEPVPCSSHLLRVALDRGCPYRKKSKKLVRDLSYSIDQNIVNLTVNRLANIWDTKEAKEGINAFFNKKKPNWIKE